MKFNRKMTGYIIGFITVNAAEFTFTRRILTGKLSGRALNTVFAVQSTGIILGIALEIIF